MGIFSRKKRNMPAVKRNMSPADIQQERLNMQSEIDKLDFELAKKKRMKELKKGQGVGDKIQEIGKQADKALSIFSDEPLKDPVGTNRKPTKGRGVIDDPFGKGLI